jgi:hypothetical protein
VTSVEPRVTGRVVIATSVPGFVSGALHVQLEDVSVIDAPAKVVARTELDGITHRPAGLGNAKRDTHPAGTPAGTVVTFTLIPSTAIEAEHSYSVRVRLDRGRDADPGPEHIWSDQSYPVLTRGFGSDVTILLRA